MSEATASSSADGGLVMAQGSPGAAGNGPIVLEPPAAGQRVIVPVGPGQPVALPDEIFDPSTAHYVIDGHDLVVTPAGGGLWCSAISSPIPTIRRRSRCKAGRRSPPTS